MVRLVVAWSAALVLAMTVPACGRRSPTAPTEAAQGRGADAAGDARVTPVTRNGQVLVPNVAVAPDVTTIAVEMRRETGFADKGWFLTVVTTFAPGTFSRADSAYCVLLDTDENSATGNPGSGPDARSFGWDWGVCAPDPRGQGAVVYRAGGTGGPSTAGLVGGVPDGPLGPVQALGGILHEFPAADQARFTLGGVVPGPSLTLKVVVMQWADAPVLLTDVVDTAPDVGAAPVWIR